MKVRNPRGAARSGGTVGPDDGNEFAPVEAIRDAIPTSRHATMLFGMVVDLLGERAHQETANAGTIRTLFLREDAGRVIPWPLLKLSPRRGTIPIPGDEWGPPLPEPASPEAPLPRLRNLGPACLEVWDGPHSASVTYGEDGRWTETFQHQPESLTGVVAAVARGTGARVELLADFVASIDLGAHGPGRLHLPMPVPPGAESTWQAGLHRIRNTLFGAAASEGARWIAADTLAGRSVAWGPTDRDALAAWLSEVRKHPPRPPLPAPPAPPETPSSLSIDRETGEFTASFTIRGPTSDIPHAALTPDNVPAALLPVGEAPRAACAWGPWVRMVDRFGNVRHAAMREEPGGFTLVGEQLADVIDLDELGAQLDALGLPERPPTSPEFAAARPEPNVVVIHYRFPDWSGAPAVSGTSWAPGFLPEGLPGDSTRAVVRVRDLTAR